LKSELEQEPEPYSAYQIGGVIGYALLGCGVLLLLSAAIFVTSHPSHTLTKIVLGCFALSMAWRIWKGVRRMWWRRRAGWMDVEMGEFEDEVEEVGEERGRRGEREVDDV
jgi:hypothetical protein